MEFPKGVIGLLGDTNSGVGEILREAPNAVRYDYTLDTADAFTRLQGEAEIERRRRAGATVLVASHQPELLRRIADEVWWVKEGTVELRGHPSEVLAAYASHTVQRFRAANTPAGEVSPSLRRGDRRAQIETLLTLDAAGHPTSIWQSGTAVAVELRVRFAAAVPSPVVGVMIRTRIGFEVYGTNTELEGVQLGPCDTGDVRLVTFSFQCDLCPQHYTITAASHDPDGVWHDWMEDAIAVTVVDTRYTAGVANLRARVTWSRG